MTFHFLDDVFLLHFTLKAPKCVFEGFSLLQSDFCQRNDTPKPVLSGLIIYCKVLRASQGLCRSSGRIQRANLPLKAKPFAQKVIFNANCTWRGGKEFVAATGLIGTWK